MAAPVDAGSVYSDVRIRLDKLTADIKSVKTGFDKLSTDLQKNSEETAKTYEKSFDRIELAGTAAIAGITIAFKQAVTTFATTEQSLANVEAVTNATASEFEALKTAAEDAGTTTRFTASQAADALFFLSSAGLDAAQSVEALDGVLLLAGATGSDLAQASQAVTEALSQYGLEADQATSVSNVFAAANSNSQATLEKLQSALRQAGPIAGQFGISLEETTASLQSLFNAGLRGEQAGTTVRNILLELGDSSSTTSQSLTALGLSFDDFNPKAVGLTSALEVLGESGLDLSTIFSKETATGITILGNAAINGEENLRDLEAAVTGTQEASRQYEVQNDTLSGSIDEFRSAAEGTSNSLIETLTPAFRGILDVGATLLRLINKLPDVVKGFGTGAGVAAGGVITLSKALAVLGVTLGTGPLGLIAILGGVAVGLTTLISKAREAKQVKLDEAFGDLAREANLAGEELDEFLKKAEAIEGALVRSFGQGFEATAEQVKNISQNLGISEKEIIAIGKASENVSDELKDQLSTLEQQIIEEEDLQALRLSQISIEEAIALSKLNQQRVLARQKAEQENINKAEQERLDRLSAIQDEISVLDELAISGAISEAEILEQKKALRQEEIDLLTEQAVKSGEVSGQIINDINAQQGKIDEYDARLEQLNAEEEARQNEQTVFTRKNAELREDSLIQSYENAEFASRNFADSVKEDNDSIKSDTEMLLDDLENNWGSYLESITDLASTIYEGLVDIRVSAIEREIEELEELTEAQLEAIDAETQAKLEALGLAEETTLESLQRQLDEAIAAGDAETAAELQDELDRETILQDAEDKKTAIEEEAEKERLQLQYEADLAEWELNKLSTIATGVQLAINAYNALAGIPVVGPALGIAAAAAATAYTGTALSALDEAKPTAPNFQTGGVVLPSQGGTLINTAENGSPEFVANLGSEGDGVVNLLASKLSDNIGGGSTTIQVLMDSKVIAQGVANNFNNGTVRVKVK